MKKSIVKPQETLTMQEMYEQLPEELKSKVIFGEDGKLIRLPTGQIVIDIVGDSYVVKDENGLEYVTDISGEHKHGLEAGDSSVLDEEPTAFEKRWLSVKD